ncbi:MAG: SRPBCC domain-containing protein [Methylophaga sp.]|nr:SRPBCC domain-containing protein [Methylophaga sp.]
MTAIINKIEPIVINRFYEHPPEKVFAAFSCKKAFEQWIAPSDNIDTRVLLHDFRINGLYRIEFSIPEIGKSFLGGEFIHIDCPRQICFTWLWEEPYIHAGVNSLVTVDFIELNGSTKLSLTHEMKACLHSNQLNDILSAGKVL